jgi:hypothetical protein
MSIEYDLAPIPNRPGRFRLSGHDLDPALCPDGAIKVVADGQRNEAGPATSADLDPFQRASVEAFVAGQAATRLLLGRAMAASRAEAWGEQAAPDALWSEARVRYLWLPRRRLLTVEQLLRQWGWVGEIRGIAPEEMDTARQEVAKADTETTRSRFVIGVRLDWDEEHSPYHAVIRDGELVAFGCEEL